MLHSLIRRYGLMTRSKLIKQNRTTMHSCGSNEKLDMSHQFSHHVTICGTFFKSTKKMILLLKNAMCLLFRCIGGWKAKWNGVCDELFEWQRKSIRSCHCRVFWAEMCCLRKNMASIPFICAYLTFKSVSVSGSMSKGKVSSILGWRVR